jgi:hypothetical protein
LNRYSPAFTFERLPSTRSATFSAKGHHALALEFADNLGQVGAWNDIEDFVRRQGTRLAHPLLAPDQAEHGDDGGDEQE